jgi:hypothetical protein
MALTITAVLGCVLAAGYDLGNGTHYAMRAVLALVIVVAVRGIRAYQE